MAFGYLFHFCFDSFLSCNLTICMHSIYFLSRMSTIAQMLAIVWNEEIKNKIEFHWLSANLDSIQLFLLRFILIKNIRRGPYI